MTFVRSFNVQPGHTVDSGAGQVDFTGLSDAHQTLCSAALRALDEMYDDHQLMRDGARVTITGWLTPHDAPSVADSASIGLNIAVAPLPAEPYR